MTRQQLLILISWVGTLHSRKRFQRTTYFLQVIGCPFDAEFSLYTIGPYSEDARHKLDEAVVLGLLEESASGPRYHPHYSYRLTTVGKKLLDEYEQTEQGRLVALQMQRFESLAKSLLVLDPQLLEVAATVMYFKRKGRDWPEARRETCVYKNLDANHSLLHEAERLAKSVEESTQKVAA